MSLSSYNPVRNSAFAGIIGIARADITPDINIYSRNWGAALHDVAKGIHQPLTLTCITFQTAPTEKPLVLIGADLGGWKNAADEWVVRGAVVHSLQVDETSVMFCLSHTHAGPSLSLMDIDKPGGKHIATYIERLRNAAVIAAQEALGSAVPAVLTWAYGRCSLATNRDLPDKNSKRIVVGYNPENPADDTLLVGRITNAQNKVLGTIVNYACHPTTLAWDNKLLSPDYVGSMRALVETNVAAPCLFLQGASGELSPAEQYSGDVKLAERNGRRLGYAVLETLESMPAPRKQISFDSIIESGAALAVWSQTDYAPSGKLLAKIVKVSFPLKPLPPLAQIEQEYRECKDRVIKERLQRKRAVRSWVGDGDTTQAPLWVWQLGDSFLAGQANEAYSDFQIELRRQFHPHAIAVMNLVNFGLAYLPPQRLYDKDIYQEWQTPFAVGSLESLIKLGIDTITEMIEND